MPPLQYQDDASSSSTDAATRYDDAFLYYSNDDVRIKTLKMAEDPTPEQVSEPQQRSISTSSASERKTMISFELHPSLIMEDVLADLCDDDNKNEAGLAHLSMQDLLKELSQL